MPEHHRDHHGDIKRREAAFEHLRAELLREASNRNSFASAKARVMHRPEVQQDPVLRAMLEQIVAEREAVFRQMPEHLAPSAGGVQPPKGATPVSRRDAEADAREALGILSRHFHDAVAHFHEAEARGLLQRIRTVWSEHPALKPDGEPAESEGLLTQLIERRREFVAHVDELANRAIHSAQHGHEDHAARSLQRLSSIHALHPDLLTDAHFEDIRRRIQEAGDQFEDQRVARKLLERERSVAAELKRLAQVIRHFRNVARTVPHDQAAYAEAEARYHDAVKAISSHDADWIGGVIIELVELLSEFHSTDKRPQNHVDRFLSSLRLAISQLQKMVSEDTPSPKDKNAGH